VDLDRANRAGEIVYCQAHFDDHFVSRSEFYQDFLLPEGLRYCFGASACRSESADFLIGLMRGPERGKLDDTSQSALPRLMPHLSGSLKLMSLFAFTPAEARLAKAIGIGETFENYAEDNGLLVSTVRCQLRSVFAKSGTGRQTDLVRLISGSPAMR